MLYAPTPTLRQCRQNYNTNIDHLSCPGIIDLGGGGAQGCIAIITASPGKSDGSEPENGLELAPGVPRVAESTLFFALIVLSKFEGKITLRTGKHL